LFYQQKIFSSTHSLVFLTGPVLSDDSLLVFNNNSTLRETEKGEKLIFLLMPFNLDGSHSSSLWYENVAKIF
jgi:hypothetical protein